VVQLRQFAERFEVGTRGGLFVGKQPRIEQRCQRRRADPAGRLAEQVTAGH